MEPLQHKFLELHSYAIHNTIYVQKCHASHDWSDHFHLPLSTEAFNQFNQLGNIVPQLNSSGKDNWGCNGQTTTYSSMQMYSNLMENGEEHPICKLIWKSKNMLKHKIFLWRLLMEESILEPI